MRKRDLEILLYETVAEALGVSLAEAPSQPQVPAARPVPARRSRPRAVADHAQRLAEHA